MPAACRHPAPAGSGELVSRQNRRVVMAHRTVQFVIGQILTDEELRGKFLDQPLETLTALRDNGVDLSTSEIDALLVTDPRLWRAGWQWVDSRLQRCRLCGLDNPKRH
jgi:hypothetical protein